MELFSKGKEEKPPQYLGVPLMPVSRWRQHGRVTSPSQASQRPPRAGLQPPSLLKLVLRARLVVRHPEIKTGFVFVLPGTKRKQSQCWPRACGRQQDILCPTSHTVPPLSEAQRHPHTAFRQGPLGTSHGTTLFPSLTEYSKTHLVVK